MNLDFEAGTTRKTHTGQEFGEITTPEGWVTWWHPDYKRPECKVINKQLDPVRVHSGEQAWLAFTMFAQQYAGLYREVELEAGTYELTAHAHAWSSHTGELASDGPHCSTGVGCGGYYSPVEDVPAENGDPFNDSIGNFTFYVGVGFGEPDPFSADIKWSPGDVIYNAHHKLRPVRFTVPEDGKVVIYLKAKSKWNYRQSDAYWDDVELREFSEQPEYESTMLVLPQDATQDQLMEIFNVAYPKRRTFGFSHDDAGHLNGTAILYNIPENEHQAYLDYYSDNYPEVTVEFEYTTKPPEPEPTELKLAYPTTHMPPRITSHFGVDRGTYIHMGLDLASSWRVWGDETLCALESEVVFVGEHPRELGYGQQVKTMTTLADGRKVRVRYAHFLGDGIYVSEGENLSPGDKLGKPNNTGNSTGDHLHIDVQVNGEYVDPEPLIEFPQEPPQPIDKPTVSFHIQGGVDGIEEYVSRVKPNVLKLVNVSGDARRYKQISPDTLIVFRQVYNDWDHYILHQEPEAGAREYLSWIRPKLDEAAEYIDYVEGLNETIATGNVEDIKRVVRFESEFAYLLAETGYPVNACLLNPGVGNPGHNEVNLLLPAARAAVETAGVLGYHCFSHDTEVMTEQGWMTIQEIVENKLPVLVASLDRESGNVEYQLPTKYLSYDYEGEMVHINGKVDTLVTPNHRIFWRPRKIGRNVPIEDHLTGFSFERADSLKYEFELKRDFGIYTGDEVGEFILPEYSNQVHKKAKKLNMDDWLEFFGYYITEGSHTAYSTNLHQKPGDIANKMEQVLGRLKFDYSTYNRRDRGTLAFAVHDVQLSNYLHQFGLAREKFIPAPLKQLSKRQLRILFTAMMDGDGSQGTNQSSYYCSASRRLATDFQEIAIKLGYVTTLSKHVDGYYYVSLGTERKTPRTSTEYIETIPYHGKVYCLTVPNGLLYVQRNGKPSWQGNSYWPSNKQQTWLETDWKHFAGRFEEWDRYFRTQGLAPKYIATEGGPIGNNNVHLNAGAGWRDCIGEWDRTQSEILRFDALARQAVPDRYLGITLFTVGGGDSTWRHFFYTKPEFLSLIEALNV